MSSLKTNLSKSSVSEIKYKDNDAIKLYFEDGHKLLLELTRYCCELSLFFKPNLEACRNQKIVSIKEDKNIEDRTDNPQSRFFGHYNSDYELIIENDDDKLHVENDDYYIKDNTINVNLNKLPSKEFVVWHKYIIKLDNDDEVILWSCTISNGYYDGDLTTTYV